MKVLLINPPSYQGTDFIREGRCEQRLSSFQYCMVPISLPGIAALLRVHEIEVKIVDCIAVGINPEMLIETIKGYAPELCILNIATATYNGDREIVKKIKEGFDCHLTAIGNHVTSLPEHTLTETVLDSVIIGEPEITALELSKRLSNKEGLRGVSGTYFKENSTIISNPKRPFIENLDELPFPARDLIDNKKYYLPVINETYTLLISSRGCPYKCIFCTAHQYYGRKLRLRSPENVLEEIEEIINKHKIHNITMWSDTFTLNREFVVAISKGIIERKLDVRWMTNSRVDTVDPELLLLMKKSNCIGISYGIESGVQEILDNVNKGTTVQQIIDAVRWTKEARIETLAHVILGLPGETLTTIDQTIRFIKKLEPDYVQFYCAIPFPGTILYQMAKEQNWLITNDWDKFELNQVLMDTPLLSSEELRKGKIKAYKKFYLRPKYIFKRMGKVRSLNDIVTNIKQGLDFISNWVIKT